MLRLAFFQRQWQICCRHRATATRTARGVAWMPVASVLKTLLVLWNLARRLSILLGSSPRWMVLFARLLCFALFISPALFKLVPYYIFNPRISRGVRYGPHRRNDLDIHFPAPGVIFGVRDGEIAAHGRPIVILVCGGSWMIGYKLWTLALCRTLTACGIIAVAIDYRNFPQVTASGMVHDVSTAISAVLVSPEVASAGGDLRLVYVWGQSAGAHLAACAVIERAVCETLESAAAAQALIDASDAVRPMPLGRRQSSVVSLCRIWPSASVGSLVRPPTSSAALDGGIGVEPDNDASDEYDYGPLLMKHVPPARGASALSTLHQSGSTPHTVHDPLFSCGRTSAPFPVRTDFPVVSTTTSPFFHSDLGVMLHPTANNSSVKDFEATRCDRNSERGWETWNDTAPAGEFGGNIFCRPVASAVVGSTTAAALPPVSYGASSSSTAGAVSPQHHTHSTPMPQSQEGGAFLRRTRLLAFPASSALGYEEKTVVTSPRATSPSSCAPLAACPDAMLADSAGSNPQQPRRIRRFFGISGTYAVAEIAKSFQVKAGVPASFVQGIFEGDFERYSPLVWFPVCVAAAASAVAPSHPGTALSAGVFPPLDPRAMPAVSLYHGECDECVPPSSSTDFAAVLQAAGVDAHATVFAGKSHTDPILEDPLGGREPLLQCMLERMWSDVVALAGPDASHSLPQHWQTPHSALVPDSFLRLARWVNPF